MLSLAILNFNGADSLRESIQSVLDQTLKPDRFIVIDNASTDNSRQIAVDMGVEVVDADNRFKFITGLNKAMDLNSYRGTRLFFMQNDVVLDKNCIKYMLEDTCFLFDFIAQPVIYDSHGDIDNSGMDYKWPGYGKRRRNVWWEGALSEDCGLVTTICFMTDIFFHYDERFFPAYYEDIDIYLRKKGKIKNVLIPSSKAIHRGNHTFSQTYKKEEISKICLKNRNKLIRKHYSGLDQFLRLTMSAVAYIMAKSLRVITQRRVAPHNLH